MSDFNLRDEFLENFLLDLPDLDDLLLPDLVLSDLVLPDLVLPDLVLPDLLSPIRESSSSDFPDKVRDRPPTPYYSDYESPKKKRKTDTCPNEKVTPDIPDKKALPQTNLPQALPQNLYPTTIVAKTNRVNKVTSDESIVMEKKILDEFLTYSDKFDHEFCEHVRNTYDLVKNQCGVHAWRKTRKRLAMIICIFYLLGSKYDKEIPIIKMRNRVNCNMTDVMSFLKVIDKYI